VTRAPAMPRTKPISIIEQLVATAAPEVSPRAIEIDFFRRLDDTYFYKKAFALHFALQNEDRLNGYFTADPAGLVVGDDDIADALIAEIHLARLQLSETVFALMVAAFQVRSHPVFVSEYTAHDVRSAVERFVAGDALGFSGGAKRDLAAVIDAAIYTDLEQAGGEEWGRNIANTLAVLTLAGRDLLRAPERTPLARGLHIRMRKDETAVLLDGPEADAAHDDIEQGVAFYQLKRRAKDGHHNLYRAVKEVSTAADLNLIYCLTLLLRSIKQTRLARYRGQTKAPFHSLASVDIAAIEGAMATGSTRRRLGIVVGADIYGSTNDA